MASNPRHTNCWYSQCFALIGRIASTCARPQIGRHKRRGGDFNAERRGSGRLENDAKVCTSTRLSGQDDLRSLTEDGPSFMTLGRIVLKSPAQSLLCRGKASYVYAVFDETLRILGHT
jgi:hypothetical protein